MSDLPAGWSETALSAIADLRLGKMLDRARNKGVLMRYLRNINVRWGAFDLSNVGELRLEPEESRQLSIQDGDVLVCEGGEPGRCAVWRGNAEALTFQKAIHRVRLSDGLMPALLAYQLRDDALGGRLMPYFTGSTIRHFTGQSLARYSVKVPPLAEQKRIADKLDKLLARIDACQGRLEIAKGLLRDFRTAVLHSAVTGVLSAAWRDNQNSSAWTECVVGDVGAVSGGLTKNARRDTMQLKRPYLRVANVHANRLDLEDVALIGGTEDEFNKTRLDVGDLLIVEGNGSLGQVGRVAMWCGELPACSHQNHLIRWRAGPHVLPKFVLYWLMSPIGRQALMDRASSSSGLHTLSISKIRSLPISIPALAEQAEIVRRIEMLLAWADAAGSRLASAASQVSNLPSAALAKAFRGELVPQDPSDDPAQAMLDRLASR